MSFTPTKQKLALRRLANYGKLNPEKYLPKNEKRIPNFKFETSIFGKKYRTHSK